MGEESHFLKKYFEQIYIGCNQLELEVFNYLIKGINNVRKKNSKIIIAGNGGSAAIASHVSVDFTKAAGIRAVNFNEADLITCFSNDFGYENWLSQAIRSYALKDDFVILISSSGKSLNMINAAKLVREMKLPLITLTGFEVNNPLKSLGVVNGWVNSNEYNVIEMTHHIWLLSIMDFWIQKHEL